LRDNVGQLEQSPLSNESLAGSVLGQIQSPHRPARNRRAVPCEAVMNPLPTTKALLSLGTTQGGMNSQPDRFLEEPRPSGPHALEL